MPNQQQIGVKQMYITALLVSVVLGCFHVGGLWLTKSFKSEPALPIVVVQPELAWVSKIPADARPYVAAFYRDMCAVIESTEAISTKDQFRTAHYIATKTLDKAKGDPDLSAVSADISAYLMECLGPEPGPLEKDKIVPALKNLADAIHANPA